SSRSVVMWIGGSAEVAVWDTGGAGETDPWAGGSVAAPGVLGTVAAVLGLAVMAGAETGIGALCFSHASQRKSAEIENTMSAMMRWVSIMIPDDSGNRVESAGVPGMAARDPTQRERRSLPRAMPLQGLDRVPGTGRRITALRAPPRAQQVAVGADERDEQPRAHRRSDRCSSSSNRASSRSISATSTRP